MIAGLLTRLFTKPETRRNASMAAGWRVGVHAGGSLFNAEQIQSVGTITACIAAIASGLGSLPARVYRREGASRIESTSHPVARLVEQPNEFQTWPDWLEQSISQVLVFGNALSRVEYDGAGRVTALRPIPWSAVSLTLLPGGRIAYDVMACAYPFGGGMVQPGRYFADEVWHLKDRSDDGITGRPRLSRVPGLLTGVMALQEFATATFANAATPSGFLVHPGALSETSRTNILTSFTTMLSGPSNARKTALLEEGMTWLPGGAFSPLDSQTLESRRFGVIECCRIMGVPPPIIQAYENNTFTNAQQADAWFARHSLMPWARKIEAEFNRSVFGAGSEHHLELDLSGLVRGAFVERWQANVAAVGAGILTVAEVREAEGYGPLPAELDPAAQVGLTPEPT